MSENLFAAIERALLATDPQLKCLAVDALWDNLDHYSTEHPHPVLKIELPGQPPSLQLVAPRQLRKRGMQSQAGRNILLHALAHIEFNAINLALDAAYRFREQPDSFYKDWLSVAADEARHFRLLDDYLIQNGCQYGDFPVHNGLWEMAAATRDSVVARMALVPRVLEARGLDVSPAMIEKLQQFGDHAAAGILQIIYQDEIGHVAIGSRWFRYHCEANGLVPRATFKRMIATHFKGEVKGPFNISARLLAGFDEQELADLGAEQNCVGDRPI